MIDGSIGFVWMWRPARSRDVVTDGERITHIEMLAGDAVAGLSVTPLASLG